MVSRLDRARLRRQWLRRPPPPSASPAPELALLGAVTAGHLADHLVVPPRFHLVSHPAGALLAAAAAVAMGAEADDLGLAADRLGPGLVHGAAVAGSTAAVIGLAGLHPASRDWFLDERVADLERPQVLFTTLVRIPVATAFAEELLFRGVILGLAMRRMSQLQALTLSSVLFGLWHVAPALLDRHRHPATRSRHPAAVAAAAVAATTVAGFAFGLQRLRSGSVLTPMLSHAATNAVTFAVGAAVAARR